MPHHVDHPDGDFAFYRACLRGEAVAHPDLPSPGRYRLPARRTSGGTPQSLPVAVWRDQHDGQLRVLIGRNRLLVEGDPTTRDAFLEFATGGWLRCVAVTQAEYNAAVQSGSWPDEHEAVTRHNQAPPEESLEAIAERIDDLAREAETLVARGAAQTQAECDRAADLANLLGRLERQADELRRREKRPHEEQAKEVDRRWRPLIERAEAGKSALKRVVITPWLAALERQRQEREFQALTLGEKEKHPAEREKVTAGTRGRPVSLRTRRRAEIVDIDAMWPVLRRHPRVLALFQEIADDSARRGVEMPGIKIVTEEVAA
jgi:hypothetical protein